MGTKRRGNGEGSIYQRADGKWCGSVSIGYDGNGKRKRRTVYGKTKRDVQEKLSRLQSQKVDGTLGDVTRLTVAEYLGRWLKDSARPKVRDSTFESYEGICRNHICPRLGGVVLQKRTPMHVQGLYSSMEAEGASPRVRQHTHAVLRRALGRALKWGIVARNPCQAVEPPRVPKRILTPLTPEQVHALLDTSDGHRLHALIVLAVTGGLRQGELFGLLWKHVDLERGVVSVRHTLTQVGGKLALGETKSATSRRDVKLPPIAVEVLWLHKSRSLSEGHAGSRFVFCDTKGGPLRKSNYIRNVWKPLLKRAGLPHFRFHDLRHASATLLLSEGVNVKIVQERLGHARISTTLDVYGHVLESMQQQAVDGMDRLFPPKTA